MTAISDVFAARRTRQARRIEELERELAEARGRIWRLEDHLQHWYGVTHPASDPAAATEAARG